VNEKCLIIPRKKSKYEFIPSQRIEVDNCLNALLHSDGRELFIMGNSGYIESK